jgi:hypothetical protein
MRKVTFDGASFRVHPDPDKPTPLDCQHGLQVTTEDARAMLEHLGVTEEGLDFLMEALWATETDADIKRGEAILDGLARLFGKSLQQIHDEQMAAFRKKAAEAGWMVSDDDEG